MRKKPYFLIARHLDNNELEFIKVNDKYGTTLEEIDLFTTDFNYPNHLKGYLDRKGIISDSKVDLFIAKQKKYNDEVLLDFCDPLYGYNDNIKPIAEASLNKNISSVEDKVIEVFKGFYRRMTIDTHFRSYVLSGNTNVYREFIKYFRGMNDKPFDEIMAKNGGWVKLSYPLIRNIMDSYDKYHREIKKDMQNVPRYILKDEILYYTADTHDFNQYSIFDDGEITREDLQFIKR